MLKEILEILSETEKTSLLSKVEANSSLPNKILVILLKNSNQTQQQIEKKLKINTNSYFKNVTLAKEIVFEIIKTENATPYDDIFLVRTLIFRGLHTQASKLILKLEEKYLFEKWFGLLDVLYHESFRMAYNSCNVKELEKLNIKVKKNLEKYHQYTLLDKQLLLDMAKCEKREVKPNEISSYLVHLEKLYNDCHKFEHHVLEFNALHCLYEVHVNYTNDYKRVLDTISKMELLIATNKEKMNERIYANMLTHITFPYCIYEIEKQPEEYFDYLLDSFRNINHHFIISEILLHFTIYYFTKCDYEKLSEMYNHLKEYTAERSNQYKETFAAVLLAFAQKDHKDFHQHKIRFYNTENSRDSLQCDLMIRYLEIILLIKNEDVETGLDKIAATEKFLNRNFSVARANEDKELIQFFRKKIKHKTIRQLPKQVFRFNNYLLKELELST